MLSRILSILIAMVLLGWTPSTLAESCPEAGFNSALLSVRLGCGSQSLWEIRSRHDSAVYRLSPPIFPMKSGALSGSLRDVRMVGKAVPQGGNVVEYTFLGTLAQNSSYALRIHFRINPSIAIVRVRYTLEGLNDRSTLSFGNGQVSYLRVAAPARAKLREVQLSQFAGLTHSYTLQENDFTLATLSRMAGVMGPILASSDGRHSLLLGYEHGSTIPERFLEFSASADGMLLLRAVKGNTLPGQTIDAAHSWSSPWLEVGAISGGLDDLPPVYREFVRVGMTGRNESRQPYIFYNTWNYQERQKWQAHRDYLQSINLERALQEIEVAHQLGIEVYVLDTGWYQATGDWQISLNRFPDGLQQVRHKLEAYGMKLGLWFGPTSASVSSEAVRQHPEWRASRDGKVKPPHAIWGTEPSYNMCLVSPYSKAFADKVIEVARATGATYFKWDAVGQHDCNDPHHDHGDEANTPSEREDAFAFQMIGRMTEAAGRIADAIPGAIVDFDVTESGRAMGLGFLSEGKYFLVNNGPYYQDFDVPIDRERDNWNLFFYPGPARTWIARAPLTFDTWIPSTLFLTHYFPDDPEELQELNVASLILGQDGIWGDLLAVSHEGVGTISELLRRYKAVRRDMGMSSPVVTGLLGGSPEVHEKISASTGRGAVVLFATASGTYEYLTKHRTSPDRWSSEGVEVQDAGNGKVKITATFGKPGAKIIYFGATK